MESGRRRGPRLGLEGSECLLVQGRENLVRQVWGGDGCPQGRGSLKVRVGEGRPARVYVHVRNILAVFYCCVQCPKYRCNSVACSFLSALFTSRPSESEMLFRIVGFTGGHHSHSECFSVCEQVEKIPRSACA